MDRFTCFSTNSYSWFNNFQSESKCLILQKSKTCCFSHIFLVFFTWKTDLLTLSKNPSNKEPTVYNYIQKLFLSLIIEPLFQEIKCLQKKNLTSLRSVICCDINSVLNKSEHYMYIQKGCFIINQLVI